MAAVLGELAVTVVHAPFILLHSTELPRASICMDMVSSSKSSPVWFCAKLVVSKSVPLGTLYAVKILAKMALALLLAVVIAASGSCVLLVMALGLRLEAKARIKLVMGLTGAVACELLAM